MDFIVISITYPHMDEAKRITHALLEARLVACGNLMPVSSAYWWQGEIVTSDEVRGIYKTKSGLFDAVKGYVQALHSYDVPCIVATAITHGEDNYLSWIDKETT